MLRALVFIVAVSICCSASAQFRKNYAPKYVPIPKKEKQEETKEAVKLAPLPATDEDQAIINRISRQAKAGNVQRQNSEVVRKWKEDRAKSIAETQQRKAEIAAANYEQRRQEYNAWAKRQNGLANTYEHSRAAAQADAEVRWDFYQRVRVNDYLRQNPVMLPPVFLGPYGNANAMRPGGGY